MTNTRSTLRPVAALLALATTIQASAEPLLEELTAAVVAGKTAFDFRYRYEAVDQNGIGRDAGASTLRSRITWTSGSVRGFDARLEADHILSVGSERYNSTVNNNTRYPVVADPDGFDLNQAWLRWQVESTVVTLGRQRINHGSQRFLGGVAWRQNEQTLDAARLAFEFADTVTVDYAWFGEVRRIFGPDNGVQPARWDSDSHVVRAHWAFATGHSLTGFSYLLDFDNANGPINSSTTVGAEYAGAFGPVVMNLSYAHQTDYADNPRDYEADYLLAEAHWTLDVVTLTAGYELLGSDDGNGAFRTPLATGHKFQGWADKFLVTPDRGVRDAYVGARGKAGPVTLMARWHDFSADDGGADYGRELNVSASWLLWPRVSLQLKGARYLDDDFASDTTKGWMTLQVKL